MIAGCGDKSSSIPPTSSPVKADISLLETKNEVNYDSKDAIYKVTGTTLNSGTSTAHNAYVRITFTDTHGSALHVHDVQLGNITQLSEQSFSYNWLYFGTAKSTVKTYWDEYGEKPIDVPTVPPEPAYLYITTEPSGATVEVGIQNVGGRSRPGTGRIVGTTPITVELKSTDLTTVNNFKTVEVRARLEGHGESIMIKGFPDGIEHGKTYTLSGKLPSV